MVFRSAQGETTSSSSSLSIQGQQLATLTTPTWPGVLEEIDEEDALQRELDEEEYALLWETDPVAARERALKETLHVERLNTPQVGTLRVCLVLHAIVGQVHTRTCRVLL